MDDAIDADTEARNIVNFPNIGHPGSPHSRSFEEDSPRSPKRHMELAAAATGPPSPNSPHHVPCMTDLGQLVRRVKNVRIAFAPETCV